jgi:hypothetical protein
LLQFNCHLSALLVILRRPKANEGSAPKVCVILGALLVILSAAKDLHQMFVFILSAAIVILRRPKADERTAPKVCVIPSALIVILPQAGSASKATCQPERSEGSHDQK